MLILRNRNNIRQIQTLTLIHSIVETMQAFKTPNAFGDLRLLVECLFAGAAEVAVADEDWADFFEFH